MGSEKNFENRVKAWLEKEGIYPAGTPEQDIVRPVCGWFFKTWGGGFQKAGLPDLIINVNGFFLGVELKGDGGRPSALQVKNVQLINRGNGLGLVLYPKGFEQFKFIVRGVKQCNAAIPVLSALKAAHTSTNCDTLTV